MGNGAEHLGRYDGERGMNTPRTEDLLRKIGAIDSTTQFAQHARQLEREVQELTAALERLLDESIIPSERISDIESVCVNLLKRIKHD